MSKPDFTHISPKDYLEKWDDYALAVLKGSIAFHGAHPSAASGGAEFVAKMADQMMILRQQRMAGLVEEHETQKEEVRQSGAKSDKKLRSARATVVAQNAS